MQWAASGGAARYNQILQVINNKPSQCSDGRDSPLLRGSAAREEQGDLFKFQGGGGAYIRPVLLEPARFTKPELSRRQAWSHGLPPPALTVARRRALL